MKLKNKETKHLSLNSIAKTVKKRRSQINEEPTTNLEFDSIMHTMYSQFL